MALTALSLYSGSLLAANFSASFKNTDIREFIDTVGRNLNKTILVDPSVQWNRLGPNLQRADGR